MPARITMSVMTTSSSISVKAGLTFRRVIVLLCLTELKTVDHVRLLENDLASRVREEEFFSAHPLIQDRVCRKCLEKPTVRSPGNYGGDNVSTEVRVVR